MCMWACVCLVCKCECMCICVYVSACVWVHGVCECMCVYVWVCMWVHVCIYVNMCLCVCPHESHATPVWIRGKLVRVSFCLLLCGSWDSNSGGQLAASTPTWWAISSRPTSCISSQFMGKRESFKKTIFKKMSNVMKTQSPHFKVLLWDTATVKLRREWSPVCCKRGKPNTVPRIPLWELTDEAKPQQKGGRNSKVGNTNKEENTVI